MQKEKLEFLHDYFYRELSDSRRADYGSEETSVNEKYLEHIEAALKGETNALNEEMFEILYKKLTAESDAILDLQEFE